ncbi:MAG TPA: hypothetical protein VMM12_13290 [Longimicrobiales bacterium]|nr:hypothetical protein [Longimicrobiales bacterium]
MTDHRDFDAERRRIIRRISLLTWGLWGAALLLAVGGGALLAWIFRGLGGLSFGALWLLAAVILIAAPALVHVGMRLTGRRNGRRGDAER